MDINNVVLTGRLVRDCESKATPTGASVCNFSLAVGKKRKVNEEWQDEASFFDIAIFGKMAEALTPYLAKGQQVAIQGELKQERWEKDGQSHSKIRIIASAVQLLGKKDTSSAPMQVNNSAPTPEFNEQDEIPF